MMKKHIHAWDNETERKGTDKSICSFCLFKIQGGNDMEISEISNKLAQLQQKVEDFRGSL